MSHAAKIEWRAGTRGDVAAVVALLQDDPLGALREGSDLAPYLDGFDAMQAEAANHLIVGCDAASGRVLATYQITFISGLSLKATRRALVESVRVAADLRSGGVGAALMADAEARARAAGCGLIQLTTNKDRARAHRFYERLGFAASHLGFKKPLV